MHDFNYLNQSGCSSIEGVDDASDFATLKAAMLAVGIDKQQQTQVHSLPHHQMCMAIRQSCNASDFASLSYVMQLVGTDIAYIVCVDCCCTARALPSESAAVALTGSSCKMTSHSAQLVLVAIFTLPQG